MKIFIARDQGYTEYESITDDRGIKIKVVGKLHIFYDKPEFVGVEIGIGWSRSGYRYWTNSRIICEVPSYMFPDIQEGECVTFESN